MIQYETGGCRFFSNIFLHYAGSVFPQAVLVALPCSALSAFMVIAMNENLVPFLQNHDSVLKDNAVWGGFNFLVGFLIVFRTSQSYNRFWEGCTCTHNMRTEWYDACSSLMAFSRFGNTEDSKPLHDFQNVLIRLFSMLHSAALGEIEDGHTEDIDGAASFKFELLDVEGIDAHSLKAVRDSRAKVELIFQWIQSLIVDNIKTGVLTIPPPILTRAFHEIANGMVAFHTAMKLSQIPFPFPYAQTCDLLLVLHWLVSPVVVSQWVSDPGWGAVFTFIQVFILWCLNFIAVELENPFGDDANDIDGKDMQQEMNELLILLVNPNTLRVPTLSRKAQNLRDLKHHARAKSFVEVWHELDSQDVKHISRGVPKPNVATRKSMRMSAKDKIPDSFDLNTNAPKREETADSRVPAASENGHGKCLTSKVSFADLENESTVLPPDIGGTAIPWLNPSQKEEFDGEKLEAIHSTAKTMEIGFGRSGEPDEGDSRDTLQFESKLCGHDSDSPVSTRDDVGLSPMANGPDDYRHADPHERNPRPEGRPGIQREGEDLPVNEAAHAYFSCEADVANVTNSDTRVKRVPVKI